VTTVLPPPHSLFHFVDLQYHHPPLPLVAHVAAIICCQYILALSIYIHACVFNLVILSLKDSIIQFTMTTGPSVAIIQFD
jgi:hypothetical protein